MRYPSGDFFVDGNPDGGTIVRAAFLNAVLGELVAILEIGGIEADIDGELPGDHHQIADLLTNKFIQIAPAESYPPEASNNSILIDYQDLLNGNWPFRIYRNGLWETTLAPLATPEGGDGAGDGEPELFSDVEHGQRGGGNLHAVATEGQAGFLSPQGFQTLTALASTRPRVYEAADPANEWLEARATVPITVQHDLGVVPTQVVIWFRNNAQTILSPVSNFFSIQQRFCGASVVQIDAQTVTVIPGDRVWAGYTQGGYQEFSLGQYKIIPIGYGPLEG